MDEIFYTVIAIGIIFVLFFIAYKLIRKLLDSDFRKSIITGELKEDSSKMTIKIRDWFTWNVQVNNEKGTAGGNIKINFPIKSALGISAICVVIAILAKSTGASFLVSLIFLSFAVYHFRKWYKSFKIISAHEAFENIKRLNRRVEKKYIGGVCAGIHNRYLIPVVLIRISFIGLSIVGGMGVFIYILLWILLPTSTVATS